jgi:hypothetical protein
MNRALFRSETFIVALITLVAVLVHGYHFGTDDSAIYIPSIEKVIDPSLFPFGSEFFLSHARLSLFSEVIGYPARLTHVSAEAAVFIWYIVSLFLTFFALRKLACECFHNEHARWAGVVLVAGVLTVPVAGTALIMVDPYLTARSLSTPATIFAIAAFAANKPVRAVAWLLATALVHPQMACYCGALLLVMTALRYMSRREANVEDLSGVLALAGLPLSFTFGAEKGPYREALFSRSYFFVTAWAWYEWAGAIAPLLMLGWMSRANLRGTLAGFRWIARGLVVLGVVFTIFAFVLALPPGLQNFARLQPMRSFHLIYVIFFLLLGGLAGEYLLKRVPWRWLCVFMPLACSMCVVQVLALPASPHIELPGAASSNAWVSAFVWIRDNTPKNAIFALDPDYLGMPGEDLHGFRAVAERSVLADNLKDSGAVSVFPQLANSWKAQTIAQSGWNTFTIPDFRRLRERYGVTWVILNGPSVSGLTCVYSNRAVNVCRIDPFSS